MSLPALNEIINTIVRSKKLLAQTIKHNISVGKLEILDIPLECQYCGRGKSHMVYFDFLTLMGRLSLHVCLDCRDMLAAQAEKDKQQEENTP